MRQTFIIWNRTLFWSIAAYPIELKFSDIFVRDFTRLMLLLYKYQVLHFKGMDLFALLHRILDSSKESQISQQKKETFEEWFETLTLT